MTEAGEATELLLRPSRSVRIAALLVLLVGLTLPFVADPIAAAVLVGAGFVLAGVVGLRVAVRVGPEGVAINSGLRATRIPWGEIEGFRFESGRSGGVYVLSSSGEVKQLPWEELHVFGTKSRRTELTARLEGLRAPYQG